MSDLETFRIRISETAALQEQLRNCKDLDSIVAIAEGEGFECTPEEVQNSLESGELTGFALELVSGGAPELRGPFKIPGH